MNAEFVRQHAPDIDLPYNGSWITPEPEAGLQAPENLYGSDGMPLNYIQDAGGPRQFYAPNASAPVSAPGAPVRTRVTSAPRPIDTLRGSTDPSTGTFGSTIPLAPQPTSPFGLATETPMQRTPSRSTPSQPRPGSTILPGEQWTTRGERQGTMTRVGPQGTSPSGMMEELGISRRQSTSTASTAQPEDNHPLRGIGGRLTENPNGTLADLFQQLGINIQLPERRPSGTQETTGLSPESLRLPTIDAYADLASDPSRNGRVTRTSAGAPGTIPMFDLRTSDGLADFNRRTGFTLGNQVRTQAEQDSLYNRGLTRTRNSAHLTGLAFDAPPSQIDGLTGASAVQAVRQRLQRAGYNVDNLEIKWETGRGRHQGTGPHVHVEPR